MPFNEFFNRFSVTNKNLKININQIQLFLFNIDFFNEFYFPLSYEFIFYIDCNNF
jgi:hypothetical protein